MLRFNFHSVVAAVVVGIATSSAVQAQDYSTGGYGVAPWGYGYGYGGISVPGTPAGATNFGTGVGLGAYYTGLGNYNYNTGRGLEHREAAREHYLYNRTLAVQTYFDRRRINEENRAANRPAPVSMEQAAANARAALPNRLGVYDIDAVTGTINWPESLRDERFAELREQLSSLFATRAKTGAGLGSATHRQIVETTEKLQTALRQATFKDTTNPLNSSAFLPAKKFLDSVAYEARFVPETRADHIAAN
jgi:hypothetical protein